MGTEGWCILKAFGAKKENYLNGKSMEEWFRLERKKPQGASITGKALGKGIFFNWNIGCLRVGRGNKGLEKISGSDVNILWVV